MKKLWIITALLAALLLLCGCGEPEEPLSPVVTDDMQLVGLIKYAPDEKGEYTQKVSRSAFNRTAKGGFVRTDKDANGQMTMGYTYDALGRIQIEQVFATAADGQVTVENERHNEYDGESDRITRQEEWREGKLFLLTVSSYNEKGDLLREEMTSDEDGDGQFRTEHIFVYTYTYDDRGQLIRTDFVNETAPDMNTAYTYQYDENGNRVRSAELKYDREYYVTEWEFDDHGGKTAERYYEDGALKRMAAWRHSYDEKGQLTRTDSGDGSGSFPNYTLYFYDTHGNCTRTENYEGEETQPVSYTTLSYLFSGDQLASFTQESHSYNSYSYRTVFEYEKADGDFRETNQAILRACGYEVKGSEE